MLCDQCLSTSHCEKFGRVCKAEGIITLSALDKQISGNHYKDKGIQPIIYIHSNNLGFCEGNVVKYVTRWREKGGVADLRKAIHYIELLIQLETEQSQPPAV
jgi:hypothetical protein